MFYRAVRIGDQEVEDGEEPTYNITVRKDTFEIVLEGLDPYTRYQIKVSGFSRMGDGPSAITAGGMVSSLQLCSGNKLKFFPLKGHMKLMFLFAKGLGRRVVVGKNVLSMFQLCC